jgi:hypothetical protein
MTDEEPPQTDEAPAQAPVEAPTEASVPPPPAIQTVAVPPPAAAAGNGFSVASLVLGIVGVVLTITVVGGLICDVLAVVFGALGRTKAREAGGAHGTNAALATAGMILGLVGLGLLLLFVIIIGVNGVHWHVLFHHRMMFHR